MTPASSSTRRFFLAKDVLYSGDAQITEELETLSTFLDRILPPQWEIYVQPCLNGDRPPLVIFHPTVGMTFFEIMPGQHQPFSGEYDEPLSANRLIKHVERYRDNLIGLYVPQIGEAIDDDPRTLAAFKIALYFPALSTEYAQKMFKSSETRGIAFGRDALQDAMLDAIVPDARCEMRTEIDPSWAERIRFWLNPPIHPAEEGRKIPLTREQQRHAKPAAHRHHRLRGAAGSGKTFVLAQRAAQLAAQGKKVLIVTFNITLWHYIREHIARVRVSFNWEQIEFTHFHGFCRNYLAENGIPWPRRNGASPEEFFDQVVVKAVIDAAFRRKNLKSRRYDAILIDEGQDFQRSYYQALCNFLTENDEVFMVVDERQNVYDRKLHWLDSPAGTKFKGAWRELTESHRLPVPIIEQANAFAGRFLPDIGAIPMLEQPQLELKLLTPHLIWREIETFEQAKEKLTVAVDWLMAQKHIQPQEMIILVPTNFEGCQLVALFEQRGFQINHIFENGTDAQAGNRKKKAFWTDDGRMKISTIHSFKGWELRNVIILPPPPDVNIPDEKMDYLLYTAITRTKENLIVFNRHPKYREYGKNWPNTWA